MGYLSSILNHLILIGKCFAYSNGLMENVKFQFANYIKIHLCEDKINIQTVCKKLV